MGTENSKPYIPDRNPRDVNVIARMNALKNRKPVFVQDEDVQHADMVVYTEVQGEKLSEEIGVPGGIVPLDERGLIDPKYLPTDSGGAAVMTARTVTEFPEVGAEDKIYIATSENDGKGYIYRWCEGLHCYERPDDSLDEVSEIYGGSAADF